MTNDRALELFKEGDILSRGDDWIFIFAGLEERAYNFHVIRYHALLNKTSGYHNMRTSTGIGTVENYNEDVLRLATNQEKEKLFKCIKQLGYEWDDKKLELRPIEPELPF
jgi:hypothetical protein